MATVYLTNGETIQVSLEDLENFLNENCDRIETRRKKLRRNPVDSTNFPISNK